MKRKNKVLITGIAGFAGSYLSERLLSAGYEIHGLLAPGENTANIEHILPALRIERFDLTHQPLVHQFIINIKPQYIFHLAAQASVGQSIQQERQTYNINFFGSLNILEAALEIREEVSKIILVGSADSYGVFKPIGKKLREDEPFRPVSPYGISKAATEFLASYYFHQHRLPVVVARSFNHIGPRQSPNFAVPSFCRQIARIEQGRDEPVIKVGDLRVKRDLTDVRDIVNGYYLLAKKGKAGEAYHLCSGKAVSLRSVLNALLEMSHAKIKVTIDKNRLRKTDIPILLGDSGKAERRLGWHRRYRMDVTLRETLNYWREMVENEKL